MGKIVQQSLFEEFSGLEQTVVAVSESAFGLQISRIGTEELSLAQLKFNTLVQQIEKLRAGIDKEKAKISHICDFWKSQGLPALVKTSQMQVKLARAIDRAVATMKLGSRQKEQIGESIRCLLDDAANNCELSEADLAVYEHWVGMGLDEARQASQAVELDNILAMMRDLTGIELEKPEIVETGDFSFDDFLKKAWEQANQKNDTRPKNQKRKTKKQLEREALEQAALELEKKSVRSVYISLAKVLHPDLETDPDRQADKKDMMQQLTKAYESNDLHTLLTMEMEWVNQQASQLGSLSDEKLSAYIEVLKDQVRELKNERSSLWMHYALPGMDSALFGKPLDRAERFIMEGARQNSAMSQAILLDVQQIERGISKQNLLLLLQDHMPPWDDRPLPF